MNKNIYKIWVVGNLFMFLSSSIFAKHDFKDYSKRANDHFILLQDVYNKYPVENKNSLIQLISIKKKKWNDIELNYKQSEGRQKSQMLFVIRENYLDLLGYVHSVCLHLRRYSNDILIDFIEKRKGDDLNHKEIEIYKNSFNVAKREIHRAKKAFLNQQYNYSAKLYDRAVIILANTYRKLNWAVPTTYKDVQTINKNSSVSVRKTSEKLAGK